MLNHLHYINNGDHDIVFDTESLDIHLISSDHSVNDTINYSQTSSENNDYNNKLKGIKLCELSFPTVHGCNLRCKYCFAKSGKNENYGQKFSEDLLQKSLAYFFDDFGADATNYKISFVSGGEPLLNLPLLKRCFQLIKSYNRKVEVFLCTNGTIYDKDIEEFLIENSPALGISIDGDAFLHNQARIFDNDEGSYDCMYNNFLRIRDSKQLSLKTKKVWGLTVLHKKNFDLMRIIQNYKDMGITRAQMKFVRLEGDRNGLKLDYSVMSHIKDEYYKLFLQLLSDARNNDLSTICLILNSIDYFGKKIVRIILRTPIPYRCNAARNKIAITANGNIYPCDSFVGNEGFLLGNVEKGIDNFELIESFCQLHILNRNKCKDCWGRFVCSGDCYYNSFIVNGSISEVDEFECEIQLFLTELAIRYVAQLKENYKDYYKKIKRLLMIK